MGNDEGEREIHGYELSMKRGEPENLPKGASDPRNATDCAYLMQPLQPMLCSASLNWWWFAHSPLPMPMNAPLPSLSYNFYDLYLASEETDGCKYYKNMKLVLRKWVQLQPRQHYDLR